MNKDNMMMCKTKIKLNNDLYYDHCPICLSKQIGFIGSITYSPKLYFSTFEIEVSKTPELWSCKQCDSRFTQNAIKQNDAEFLYSDSDSDMRWGEFKVEQQIPYNVVKELEQYFKGGNILDIGAGSGSLLDYAKKLNCTTFAMEISRSTQQRLAEKGHSIIADLDKAQDESFDVITAFDLIEHLYDVPNFINDIFKKIKKNGHLIVHTGNSRSLSSLLAGSKWWYVSYPEHVVFPSKKYFLHLKNFELIKCKKVFANTIHEKTLMDRLKNIMLNLLHKKYTGLPSLFADHNLFILRRKL